MTKDGKCECHAFEPDECTCGAWDDVAEGWYGDEELLNASLADIDEVLEEEEK